MSQNHSPLVSIIIPCYKAERELPDALRSVSQQTYSHWEIIAVNDCWDDDSEKIIHNFRSLHPNNNVLYTKNTKNLGLAGTRNVGINLCRGQYIAFLDHDDVWENQHLETGLRLLNQNQAEFFFTPALFCTLSIESTAYVWGPTAEDLKQFSDALLGRNFIAPSGAIISKDLIKRIGPMDESLRCCEDHDYWLRAITHKARFCQTDTPTVKYRIGNTNSLTSKTELMFTTDIKVQKRYLNSLYFDRKKVRRSIALNYINLSNNLYPIKPSHSLLSLVKAFFWNPSDFPTFKKLIKNLVNLPSTLTKTYYRSNP